MRLNKGFAAVALNLLAILGGCGGALAQATADVVPYALLAVACVGTAVVLRGSRRASASPATPGSLTGEPGTAVDDRDEDLPTRAGGG